MPYCLLPLDGGPPIVLEANELVIGRDPGCDVTITGCDTVSRRHCRLTRSGHYFEVHDLNSRNGVRVNGHLVHEAACLKPGDSLRLGGSEFVLADRSREAIEALAAAPTPTSAEVPGVTQPLRFSEDDLTGSTKRRTTSSTGSDSGRKLSRTGRGDHRQPESPAGKRGTAKKAGLRAIGQKSWDAIVAFERAAPAVKRKPPRRKVEKKEAQNSEQEEGDRALVMGYATRPAADASWDHCRLGLMLTCWAGLAAGLVMLLTWLVPGVPLLAQAMRMAGNVFVPFQSEYVSAAQSFEYGMQMVILGALPIVFCMALREIAPSVLWPSVATILIGLVLGQIVRPANPEVLFAFYGAMQTTMIVAGICLSGGLCLTCLAPRRASLGIQSALAAGTALAAIAAMAAVALSHIRQMPGLTVPVGRPPSLLLEAGLAVTGLAAPVAILLLMRRIGRLLSDQPLVESVDTCLTCVAVAGAAAAAVWYLVVTGGLTGTWADVLLVVAAAGGNLALIWTAQTAGFTRDALR